MNTKLGLPPVGMEVLLWGPQVGYLVGEYYKSNIGDFSYWIQHPKHPGSMQTYATEDITLWQYLPIMD